MRYLSDGIWRIPEAYSEDVAKAIDREIHSIIDECHDKCKEDYF